MTKKQLAARLIVFFAGIFILSLGIVLIIKANLGAPAWDVLHIGMYKTLGLTIGTWSQIIGLIIVSIALLIYRHVVSFGTVLNIIFIGWFIDLFIYILPEFNHLLLQSVILIIGILIMGFGVGLYISANIGTGPRDSLMMALSIKYGWNVAVVKTIMELLAIFVGWLLGGPVFVGTFIAAFMIGPVIRQALSFSIKWVNPIFDRYKKMDNSNEDLGEKEE